MKKVCLLAVYVIRFYDYTTTDKYLTQLANLVLDHHVASVCRMAHIFKCFGGIFPRLLDKNLFPARMLCVEGEDSNYAISNRHT